MDPANLLDTITDARPSIARYSLVRALGHAIKAGDFDMESAYELAREIGQRDAWDTFAGEVKRMTGQATPRRPRSRATTSVAIPYVLRERVRQSARPGETVSETARRLLMVALDPVTLEALAYVADLWAAPPPWDGHQCAGTPDCPGCAANAATITNARYLADRLRPGPLGL